MTEAQNVFEVYAASNEKECGPENFIFAAPISYVTEILKLRPEATNRIRATCLNDGKVCDIHFNHGMLFGRFKTVQVLQSKLIEIGVRS